MARRSSSELQFDEGDRVGPYQVVRRVAPSCYDAETDEGVPIRIELASEADSQLIDIRFTRAQAQLQLLAENQLIAQIVDHGVLSSGRPWIASQRPNGTALSDVLTERHLEPREVTALVYSVAKVLAFAHHRQVVHGSLRPHHLTLSRGAKVSISGWAWLRSPGIPSFGDPATTSVYNPPEHDGQSPIDGRADVYALGAIAYRALTGVFPDVSRDLLDGNDPLCAAIENMLSLDARDRSSAAAIVADLHELRVADRAARASMKESEARTAHRASAASMPTDDRIALAEREIEELRVRASSPKLEFEESRRKRASSPSRFDFDERNTMPASSSSSPPMALDGPRTKRASSPPRFDFDERNTMPAPSSRHDVDERNTQPAPSRHDIGERTTRPAPSPRPGTHEQLTRPVARRDIEELRAKSPSSPPRFDLEELRAKRAPSPSPEVERNTRPAPSRPGTHEQLTRPVARRDLEALPAKNPFEPNAHEQLTRPVTRRDLEALPAKKQNPFEPDAHEQLTRPVAQRDLDALSSKHPSSPAPEKNPFAPDAHEQLTRPVAQRDLDELRSKHPPAPASVDEPYTRPAPQRHIDDDPDIEKRRTRPMSSTPPVGVGRPKPPPTPAKGVKRSTRPMSAVEYAAQDLGEQHTDRRHRHIVEIESALHPAVEPDAEPPRARRIISIQSAIHDAVEPNTDRMPAEHEPTDIGVSNVIDSLLTDIDVLKK